jgi:hypothetical protein
LILNILITNLDSWIFYQILIFFQFHPWIHDFIFYFFMFGPHSLEFLFLFWIILWVWFFFLILTFNSIFDDTYGLTLSSIISNFDS